MGLNSLVVAPETSLTKNLGKPPSVTDPNAKAYDLTQGGFLFNRQWSVSVGVPGQKGLFWDRLRVVFEIEKTSISTSNKSRVTVYNMDEDSRTKYLKGFQLVLKAGYPGTVDTIFSGNITQVKNERHGADILTIYECGEAEQKLYNQTFTKSYPRATPLATVIADLVAASGLPASYITGIPSQTISNGLTLSGDLKRILDTILKPLGLEWSVQNGSVQIKPIAKTTADTAIELNQNSGLIGIPTKGDGGNNLTLFTALINPKIVPGASVNLTSTTATGLFQIRKATFDGDSHGNKWNVHCEAAPVDNGATIGNVAASIAAQAAATVVTPI